MYIICNLHASDTFSSILYSVPMLLMIFMITIAIVLESLTISNLWNLHVYHKNVLMVTCLILKTVPVKRLNLVLNTLNVNQDK